MKDLVVQSITEAYSVHPVTLKVVDTPSTYAPEKSIKNIELEILDNGLEVYVGYNFEGEPLFQYLANSVNVHYK